jgi:glycosyltransferase involved in cell wall biosynthesis
MRLFDAIVVHTDFSRRRLLERGWVEESRVRVIPHGAFEHYRRSAQGSHSTLGRRLLFFGNLQPYKGVDTLLVAFSKIPPELRSKIRLVIAGRPIMDPKPLLELARDRGIYESIDWILRPIPEEQVSTLFQEATVIVLPYREIDQSGVLMTAIACGKPVIASAVGGIPETIEDGVHGRLVSPDDPDALAQALGELLSSQERLHAMECAMQALSSGAYAWANIAERTVEVYRELLHQPVRSAVPGFAEREPA